MEDNREEILTDKMNAFCLEYIIDFNQTQAAIRAGYSKDSAQQIGAENMLKPVIQKKIKELIENRSKRTGINADYVLNRLVEIDQLDIADILNDDGELLPIKQWPKAWRTSLNGFDVKTQKIMLTGNKKKSSKQKEKDIQTLVTSVSKIKLANKDRVLELIGRHVDVAAFKDGTESIADLVASFVLAKKEPEAGTPKFAHTEGDIEV